MIIPERQIVARKRINELEAAILEAVDKLCEKNNNEVTYAEINAAMLKAMTTFNGHELKELWEPAKKQDDV